jgi:hypothetical protein
LGEFSLFELLFTLGSFLKITQVAQLFELLFSTVKVMHGFYKKGLGGDRQREGYRSRMYQNLVLILSPF